jgi:beta-galactosidase
VAELGYVIPEKEDPKDEYILTVSLVTDKDYLWAKRGHEIAFEQFTLPVRAKTEKLLYIKEEKLLVTEDENNYKIEGNEFALCISKENGTLDSYLYKGVELIKQAPVPSFWRAYTDNDYANKLPARSEVWRKASLNRELLSIRALDFENKVEIEVQYLLDGTYSICKVKYAVKCDGEVQITQTLLPANGLPELPEVGMLLLMEQSFENLSWYGKGPNENYMDRPGAKIGIYSGKVVDQMVPYLRPQECGNKTEVRWATLTNHSGIGLYIKGSPLLEINALPYTPFELEKYDHQYKLPKSDKIALRINHKQMGVGGDDTWGAKTHPEFTLYANRPYEYSFSLKGWDRTQNNK